MIRAMTFDLDGTQVQTEKLKAISYARAAVSTPFTRERLHRSDHLPKSRIVDDPAQLPSAVAHIVENSKLPGHL